MQHLALKATTVAATDQGVFQAVISTASIDREKDIVDPDAMVVALQKWTQTGKKIPLAWNHSTAAADQIGYIDPASAKNVGGEVVVDGFIDQSTDTGAEVWRLVKSGTLGFSFGYLTLRSQKRQGGGERIQELDVFEVTATTTPMNGDTRVLGWKASKQVDQSNDPGLRIVNSMVGQAQEFINGENDPEDVDAMNEILDALNDLLEEEQTEGNEPEDQGEDQASKGTEPASDQETRSQSDPLRKQADDAELDFASAGESQRKRRPPKVAEAELTPINEEKAWDGSASRFTDSEYAASCILDRVDCSAAWRDRPAKQRYSIPIKDPGASSPNPDALGPAAAALAGARTPVSACPAAIVKAKGRLRAAYAKLGLDVPDSLKSSPDQETRSQSDPLRKQARAIELEFASGGESLRKPPQQKKTKPPPELIPLKELRRRMREEMLTALSGGIET